MQQPGIVELQTPPGAKGEGMNIKIVASQEAWVSITANGKKLYSGILRPNETRVLSRVERAKVVVGNAGGVDVLADGRSIGPIGPRGQVRVVLMSPNGTQIHKQPKPAVSGSDNQTE